MLLTVHPCAFDFCLCELCEFAESEVGGLKVEGGALNDEVLIGCGEFVEGETHDEGEGLRCVKCGFALLCESACFDGVVGGEDEKDAFCVQSDFACVDVRGELGIL